MGFDVEGHLGAVERSVSSLKRDGQPARAVALSRTYAMTVEDLWDAVTNGERIPRWFLPISGALEVGGRYQLEGNAGGVITACERASQLALTWEFGEDVSGQGAGRARLTLTHTAHVSEHWGQYGPGAVGVGLGVGSHGTRGPSHATDRAKAGRSRFYCFAGWQGVYHRQQRAVGASGGRGRHGLRRRAGSGKAHDRVLHWRIGRSCLMHAFDVLRSLEGIEEWRSYTVSPELFDSLTRSF